MGHTTSPDINVSDFEIVYIPSIPSAADEKDTKKLYKILEKKRKEYRKHCTKGDLKDNSVAKYMMQQRQQHVNIPAEEKENLVNVDVKGHGYGNDHDTKSENHALLGMALATNEHECREHELSSSIRDSNRNIDTGMDVDELIRNDMSAMTIPSAYSYSYSYRSTQRDTKENEIVDTELSNIHRQAKNQIAQQRCLSIRSINSNNHFPESGRVNASIFQHRHMKDKYMDIDFNSIDVINEDTNENDNVCNQRTSENRDENTNHINTKHTDVLTLHHPRPLRLSATNGLNFQTSLFQAGTNVATSPACTRVRVYVPENQTMNKV